MSDELRCYSCDALDRLKRKCVACNVRRGGGRSGGMRERATSRGIDVDGGAAGFPEEIKR